MNNSSQIFYISLAGYKNMFLITYPFRRKHLAFTGLQSSSRVFENPSEYMLVIESPENETFINSYIKANSGAPSIFDEIISVKRRLHRFAGFDYEKIITEEEKKDHIITVSLNRKSMQISLYADYISYGRVSDPFIVSFSGDGGCSEPMFYSREAGLYRILEMNYNFGLYRTGYRHQFLILEKNGSLRSSFLGGRFFCELYEKAYLMPGRERFIRDSLFSDKSACQKILSLKA